MQSEMTSEWYPTSYLELQPVSVPLYALLILNQPIEVGAFLRSWRGCEYPLNQAVISLALLMEAHTASFTICADGGANQLYDLCEKSESLSLESFIPKVIHGDLDSLLPKVEEYYRGRGSQIIRDTDQESTDFMKCLKLISSRADEIVRGSTQRLDIVALGGLGGRVDQGLSQLHHLYMANVDDSLHIGRIVLLTTKSITFLLRKGLNKVYTPPGKGLAENVGILPIGRPAVISTKGLEWDVHDWITEFGGRISTSNRIKSDVVEVQTTEHVVFTIELEMTS